MRKKIFLSFLVLAVLFAFASDQVAFSNESGKFEPYLTIYTKAFEARFTSPECQQGWAEGLKNDLKADLKGLSYFLKPMSLEKSPDGSMIALIVEVEVAAKVISLKGEKQTVFQRTFVAVIFTAGDKPELLETRALHQEISIEQGWDKKQEI